jgi:hypothetical protein
MAVMNWEWKMKTRVIACSVVALSAAFGAIVQGQEPPPTQVDFYRYALQTAGGGGRGGFFSLAGIPVESQLVKGAPYTAEVVTESVQTLADGNRIVRKTTGRVYRDSQGRTRREDDREPGKVRMISIADPVAGFSYSLNPETKTASKTPYRLSISPVLTPKPGGPNAQSDPAAAELRRSVETMMEARREQAADKPSQAGSTGARGGRGAGGGTGSGGGTGTGVGGGVGGRARGGIATPTDEKVEKLPARQIEGVMAEGVRTTRTIPAGAIGNEQPIAIVTEEWRSPELQVLVMTRTSDPRTGESTYKLLGVQRSEPNASWFEVPGDYTVRESGRSVIR